MGMMLFDCPACHAKLRVADEFAGKRARCKRCGHVFTIPSPGLDDSVVEWLSQADEPIHRDQSGETHPLPEVPARSTGAGTPSPPVPTAPPASSRVPERVVLRSPASPRRPAAAARPARASKAVAAAAAGEPAPTAEELLGEVGEPSEPAGHRSVAGVAFSKDSGLRLSHVDTLGAFFVFPSRLLEDPAFRSSLPRCCVGCGVTQSLTVHLVMWTSKLAGRGPGVLTQHDIGAAVRAEVLHRLSAEKLLTALPHVPNMPYPYDLPMPYFICARCTPAGAIMTHVRPIIEEDWEQCELGIASLKRAMDFCARNLGREHEDYAQLEQALREHKADAWRALSLPVRNRIETWYKAAPGERFLCYVRDSDFAPAEAGLGGLVMTDRRIVFRKARIQRELWITDKLELAAGSEAGHYALRIGRAGGNPAILCCDPAAAELVRHNLKMMGANYTFTV